MIQNQTVTETCKQLLDKFHATPRGNRVYIILRPRLIMMEEVIVGRVEERDSEFSQVFFFTQTNKVWNPRVHTHNYNLQDPCISFIKGELIFGGVEVITAAENPSKITSWVTQFYCGPQIDSLRHFSSGPGTIKDIRLIELADGRIGICPRRMGGCERDAFIKEWPHRRSWTYR
jgi:hypothetical protein